MRKFYTHSPDVDGARDAAAEVRLAPEVRQGVCDALREQNTAFAAGPDVARNIDRLAGGAVAVVTGQQVGLFGGPAYSFYKALTAIAVAEELSKGGIEAVPVFWLASEDHDLAEVNHCYWLLEGGLERFELQPEVNAEGRSVGRVPLGEKVKVLVDRAVAALVGDSAEWVGTALQQSYTARDSFASAFGKLVARLLDGRGLIILDPLDTRIHRLAAPVYGQALEGREALTEALLARNKELEKAGLHAQVRVTPRSTLLFCEIEGKRIALRQNGGNLSAGGTKLAEGELRSALETSPERFSANALLRPVVQDSLLPTAAYVGGPAEIAYLAQAQVIYQRLLGRMPAVMGRAGFTLVDGHASKLLKRYGFEARDVMGSRQRMRRSMESASLPRGLTRQFDKGEAALAALLSKLRRPLRKLDHTLEGALTTAERKMLHQFLKLRGKAGRAENLRTGVLDRHERALIDLLYAHGAPQERSHNLLPWLARYGRDLLDELGTRAAGGGKQHHVLHL